MQQPVTPSASKGERAAAVVCCVLFPLVAALYVLLLATGGRP